MCLQPSYDGNRPAAYCNMLHAQYSVHNIHIHIYLLYILYIYTHTHINAADIVIFRANINLICRRAISDKPVKLIGYYYETFVLWVALLTFGLDHNWNWCFVYRRCVCVCGLCMCVCAQYLNVAMKLTRMTTICLASVCVCFCLWQALSFAASNFASANVLI